MDLATFIYVCISMDINKCCIISTDIDIDTALEIVTDRNRDLQR